MLAIALCAFRYSQQPPPSSPPSASQVHSSIDNLNTAIIINRFSGLSLAELTADAPLVW